jgi:hypothetical protein
LCANPNPYPYPTPTPRSFNASQHTQYTELSQFLSLNALSSVQFSARDGLTSEQSMYPSSATASIAVVHVNKPPVALSTASFAIAGAYLSVQLTGTDQDSAIVSACITSLPQNGSLYQVRVCVCMWGVCLYLYVGSSGHKLSNTLTFSHPHILTSLHPHTLLQVFPNGTRHVLPVSPSSTVYGTHCTGAGVGVGIQPPFNVTYLYTGAEIPLSGSTVGFDSFHFTLYDLEGRQSLSAPHSITALTALTAVAVDDTDASPSAVEGTLSNITVSYIIYNISYLYNISYIYNIYVFA